MRGRALVLSLFAAVASASLLGAAQIDFNAAPLAPGASTPAAQQITLTGSINSRTGDDVRGVAVATIAEGWHVNSNKPLDEFVIPTVLTLDPSTADLVSAQYPAHELVAFAFTNGSKLAVYQGTIQIPFTAKLKPGAQSIKANLRYQACNDHLCLPPKNATADILLNVVAAPAPTTATAAPNAPAAPNGTSFTPLSAAPQGAAAAKPSLLSTDIGGTFAARGLPLTLLAIFVLGLALNLTPCVYPLIPITIGYFSSQSEGSRGQRIALSSVYVVGLAITYSALGVFSALSGRLFGAWLQLPAVLIFFALLMLVMASSMFGAFEITVPHFISDRSGGRAGLAGALTMGLLIGIVAAPCVGPFVISLIALVSSIGSPFLGFLMFFVLALGLGVPYLFLGIFSSGLNAIPRSGMWMVQVKKAMGFVLIAMAFYFLRPLLGEEIFRYGVAASLLVGAAFLFVSRAQGARVLRIAIAILLLAGGVAFALPRSGGSAVRWDRYDAKAIAAASSSKKPVVIDFYADWCMPCKELDEKTFSDAKVADELQRFTRVKANLTAADDPLTKQLTQEYAIIGVPTLVFIGSDGHELRDLRLSGFEAPDAFRARLAKVQ
jgi:thiol:disulfide interchange protein DsbD